MSDDFAGVYDEQFYRTHLNDEHQRAMNAIAMALESELHPTSVVDFGCGVGAVLDYFRVGPKATVLGIEHPEAESMLRQTGSVLPMEDYLFADLCYAMTPVSRRDLAVSIEVAEHIPKWAHPMYFDTITSASDVLFFSGAVPNQGGTGHIAEAPFQYWDKMLTDRGFHRDEEASRRIVSNYRDHIGGLWWYVNANLYRRVA